VSPDDIETFLKGLKVKGTSIGSRYADSKFLLDEVSVHFGETWGADWLLEVTESQLFS
jgi:hypothetical protein